jgi:hypothetical protein
MAQNNPQPQQNQQIQVKVTDEVLKGAYANMVQVSHGQEEFVLDFMNIFPPQGIIASRVIVSPAHMKRLVAAMEENIKRYEGQFGQIAAGSNPQHNFGFRTE